MLFLKTNRLYFTKSHHYCVFILYPDTDLEVRNKDTAASRTFLFIKENNEFVKNSTGNFVSLLDPHGMVSQNYIWLVYILIFVYVLLPLNPLISKCFRHHISYFFLWIFIRIYFIFSPRFIYIYFAMGSIFKSLADYFIGGKLFLNIIKLLENVLLCQENF